MIGVGGIGNVQENIWRAQQRFEWDTTCDQSAGQPEKRDKTQTKRATSQTPHTFGVRLPEDQPGLKTAALTTLVMFIATTSPTVQVVLVVSWSDGDPAQ